MSVCDRTTRRSDSRLGGVCENRIVPAVIVGFELMLFSSRESTLYFWTGRAQFQAGGVRTPLRPPPTSKLPNKRVYFRLYQQSIATAINDNENLELERRLEWVCGMEGWKVWEGA